MTESEAAEYLALAVGAGITALAPVWLCRIDRLVGRMASALARYRRSLPWLMGIATGLVAMLAAVHVHWPQPSVHDEFAYLMGAETFAGGELTRPTHPLWEHFETYHILQEPSYAPKYPTGQSLALALGMAAFGEPRAGLWIEVAAMVAALTWMLTRWLPGRWALLGGVLIALQLGVRGPWVQTFYGGALAATGGALLLGAVPGILQRRDPRSAALLGLGLVILALTRPFEGLVASLPVAAVLLRAWMRPRDSATGSFAVRVAVPIAAVLAVGGFWLTTHNEAVTGNRGTLPYVAYDDQYSVFPAFLWQDTRPAPEYRDPGIEWFMLNFQRGDHGSVDGPVDAMGLAISRNVQLARGILGLPLSILALLCGFGHILLRGIRRGWFRGTAPASAGSGSLPVGQDPPRGLPRALPLAVVLCVAAASSLTTYASPHYAAPALGALTLLLVGGIRRARGIARRSRGHSVPLVLAILVALAITTVERGSKGWLGGERRGGRVRMHIIERLTKAPGDDLILVRATTLDSVHQDMVFNASDIDGAPVIWARDLATLEDPGANDEILKRYGDRTVWSLTLENVLEDRWELVHLRDPQAVEPGSALESKPLPWGPW